MLLNVGSGGGAAAAPTGGAATGGAADAPVEEAKKEEKEEGKGLNCASFSHMLSSSQRRRNQTRTWALGFSIERTGHYLSAYQNEVASWVNIGVRL